MSDKSIKVKVTEFERLDGESILDEITDFKTEKCSHYYPYINGVLEQIQKYIKDGI